MSDPLTERLQACYSGAVHDVLRGMGHANCVLPSAIQALDSTSKVAGPVFTVRGRINASLDPHESLLRWTGFLSRAPRGAVVVCQPDTSAVALMGELSAETLKLRGVRGYVVDGGCRDVSFIRRIGFPVFCRFKTPADIVGRWAAEAFDEPITMGEVTVSQGDYLIGDEDGVVCIPSAKVEDVIATTEKVMQTENMVRTAILGGMDPQQAYIAHGKF